MIGLHRTRDTLTIHHAKAIESALQALQVARSLNDHEAAAEARARILMLVEMGVAEVMRNGLVDD